MHQKRMLAKQNEMQLEKLLHQQQLYDAVNQVTEMEREKIAKNVHDDLGAMLQTIEKYNNKIRRNLDSKEIIQEVLKNSSEVLEESFESIRSIALDLMPSTLTRLGYPSAISQICRHLNATEAVKINFDLDKLNFRLPPTTEFQLFRITKEVLNNIIKHSNATEINIEMEKKVNVTITVSHNGEGITSEKINQILKTNKGLGLKSIQSRIQFINATIMYSVINNESKIIITLPFVSVENKEEIQNLHYA